MPLDPKRHSPLMAITHDRPDLSHLEQVGRLLGAGITWIQLRMKQADEDERLRVASQAAALCASSNAILVVNDSVKVAILSGADGVHLGREDGDWLEARVLLGPDRILGGTINDVSDAERALKSACLDYVGVGPWRFTTTKQKLSPVLGETDVRDLIARLSPLPAWVIGGVTPTDMALIRNTGAAGAAVSGALLKGDTIASAADFSNAWNTYETVDAHNR